MKKITLFTIRLATTADGRGWDYRDNAIRYFTTEAKAERALEKKIALHKKIGNWVKRKKKGFEAAYERMWIVKTTIKIEA